MADPSAPPMECAAPVNLMTLYGPQLLGLVFSCALWGVGCLQAFFYFLSYEADSPSLKTLVAFIWALETANEGTIIAGVFPPLITNWGSVAKLQEILKPEIHRTWISTLVGFFVQLFYLQRIQRFSGQPTVWTTVALVALVILALWQVVGAFLYTAWALPLQSGADLFTHRMTALAISLRAVTAFVDIAIATWTTQLVIASRSKIWQKSGRLWFRPIILTVSCGAWTALFAILDLSLIAALTDKFWFVIFEQPLAALYVNAFLATLNARLFMSAGAEVGPSGGSLANAIALGSLDTRMALSIPGAAQPENATGHVEDGSVKKDDGQSYVPELPKDDSTANDHQDGA